MKFLCLHIRFCPTYTTTLLQYLLSSPAQSLSDLCFHPLLFLSTSFMSNSFKEKSLLSASILSVTISAKFAFDTLIYRAFFFSPGYFKNNFQPLWYLTFSFGNHQATIWLSSYRSTISF